MTFDITDLIKAFFALISVALTTFLIPYIKSRTSAQQQEQIIAWVKLAVAAAEQIYTGSGRGKEKKEYVLKWLKNHGLTMDDETIDAMIEAAVHELNAW